MQSAFVAAAFAVALALAVPASAQTPLTLDEALRRVSDAHPDLRLIAARAEALDAARDIAALRPATTLETSLENIAGSGDARGLGGAEFTLGLAFVFEHANKRAARTAVIDSRIDALAAEREVRRLDLLAEVARRYLDAMAAHWRGTIAQHDAQQRGNARDAARRRFKAGAAPESSALAAEAALARAELAHASAQLGELNAVRHLTTLWGEPEPDAALASGEPPALPALEPFDVLLARLDQSPDLARLADAHRIADTRLRLAQTDARSDISWQVGLRRLQDTRDVALVAGLSVPLGTAHRAEPSIRKARLERDALEIERESTTRALRATLIEATGRYALAREEVRRLDADVLPRLIAATDAAARAYRAGAGDYLDWSQLQSEAIDAHFQRVDATTAGLVALIEIQRLAGLPIRFAAADETASTHFPPACSAKPEAGRHQVQRAGADEDPPCHVGADARPESTNTIPIGFTAAGETP